jgi:hypothetical protein
MEYTMLLAIIIGAFLGIGRYFKRGIQGRWRAAVDDLGDQYDPRTGNSYLRHSLQSNTDSTVLAINADDEYITRKMDTTNMIERKTGHEGVASY